MAVRKLRLSRSESIHIAGGGLFAKSKPSRMTFCQDKQTAQPQDYEY